MIYFPMSPMASSSDATTPISAWWRTELWLRSTAPGRSSSCLTDGSASMASSHHRSLLRCTHFNRYRIERVAPSRGDSSSARVGLAERHQRKLLEQDLRRELAGVGGGIVLRCDLDHIGTGNLQATQAAQQRETFA